MTRIPRDPEHPAGAWPAVKDALAGEVAVDVARQLGEPTRTLRERLGVIVDALERHGATSTGPAPYPWRTLQTLRQDLATAYLEATTLARRIEELERALDDATPAWFDVATAVDHGLRLVGHHLGGSIEVLLDLAHAPPARGTPGTLALLVAQLATVCAHSAHALPGSSLSVRVHAEPGAAVVIIADNGEGSERTAEIGELARGILVPWGGTIDAASAAGQGCAFELRLLTAPG